MNNKKRLILKNMKRSMAVSMTVVLLMSSLAGCRKIDLSGSQSNESVSESASVAHDMDIDLNSEEALAAQETFEAFVQEDLVETLESNWISAHTLLENPENYGVDITAAPIEYGEIITDENYAQNVEDLKSLREEFDAIDRALLTDTQKDTYDYMDYVLETSELSYQEDYRKFDFTFATFTGLPAQIPQLLADLQLRSEDDVKALITLIGTTQELVDECIELLEDQADEGTMIVDCDGVLEAAKQYISEGEDGSTLASVLENISEVEGLDDAQITDYQEQAKTAYMNSFIPAYEDIVDAMDKLSEVEQTEGGLATLEGGRDYYEVLFRDATGSSKTVEEAENILIDLYNSELKNISDLLSDDANEDAYLEWAYDETDTGYDDYETPLEDLFEDIKDAFPEIEAVDYTIQALPEDMENSTVGAYYNIPAIDSTWPQTIFVNSMSDSIDLGSVSSFMTLAHEGFPGHMFATNYIYNSDDISDWMKILGGNSGFTEGYAVYASLFALKYLENVDDVVIEINRSMEVLENTFLALADIGIHYEGWTLSDLEAKMDDLGLNSSAASDIYDMIRANPTTYLTYYYGYAEIALLKGKAQESLGDRFSDMAFHEALLSSGETIFEVVERNVDEYIAAAQ